ncbi:MAG: potassium channel family protein [Betaproteobacteria bacterium]
MTLFLALLVVAIFVIPVAAPTLGDGGRAVVEVFFLLILLSGAWAIAEHRAAAILVAFLCAGALAITVLAPIWLGGGASMVRLVGAFAGVLVLAAVIAMKVFAPGRITTDRIMGAVALYLTLGVAWGNAYEIVALLDHHAFAGASDAKSGVERWFYFSFVTLTTVGYGDITPASRVAQALAISEALVGQLYPAIILARLVTLHATPNTGGRA